MLRHVCLSNAADLLVPENAGNIGVLCADSTRQRSCSRGRECHEVTTIHFHVSSLVSDRPKFCTTAKERVYITTRGHEIPNRRHQHANALSGSKKWDLRRCDLPPFPRASSTRQEWPFALTIFEEPSPN